MIVAFPIDEGPCDSPCARGDDASDHNGEGWPLDNLVEFAIDSGKSIAQEGRAGYQCMPTVAREARPCQWARAAVEAGRYVAVVRGKNADAERSALRVAFQMLLYAVGAMTST